MVHLQYNPVKQGAVQGFGQRISGGYRLRRKENTSLFEDTTVQYKLGKQCAILLS